MKKPDYKYGEKVEFSVFDLEEGGSVEVKVPREDGEGYVGSVKVKRSGKEVKVEVSEGSVDITNVQLDDGSLKLVRD